MSVTKDAHVGHSVKRRKLSHESNNAEDISLRSREPASNESEQGTSIADSDESDVEDTGATATSMSGSQTQKANGSVRPGGATSVSTISSPATMMLQAKNLVAEVRPDYASRIKKMRPTTDRIIEIIKAIPDLQPMSLIQARTYSQKTLKVAVPWSVEPASDINYKFSFSNPSGTTIGGTFVHHLAPRGRSTMVIMPGMPAEMFQEKDYLNYRAIHKRAFYLACIASDLQKQIRNDFFVRYSFANGNELMPVINLLPKSKENGLADFVFEISPSLPPSIGPVDKMTPAHNCLRKGEFVRQHDVNFIDGSAFYNSTIRSLASFHPLQQLLERAASQVDHFRDACLLGAIWLRQRGFSSARADGGFGLDEWAAACALLLESGGQQNRPLFSPRYSAIQLFKAMLQVLSGRGLYEPLVVRGMVKLPQSKQPVMYDAETGVNVLYKMTPWSYIRLKHYATISLSAVNSKKLGGFEPTFISKVFDPTLQFDESYEVHLPEDSAINLHQVYDVLKQALNDRVLSVDLQCSQNSPWEITSSTLPVQATNVIIGILTNPEATLRLVDHGPSVEQKQESKQFRDFWGDKAELRRFKDGSISESLVWSADAPVTQQIIEYLCAKHFKLSSSAIKPSAVLQKTQLHSSLSADEAFQAVNIKFQSLSSTLHHLDNLPLPVRSVSAASEHLRSSSLTLPLEPGTANPIDIVIQFDSSGRWPDDLRAIQYTKIAFLDQVADKLSRNDRTLETQVGLEHTSTSSLGTRNTSYLDIMYPSPSPEIPPIIFRMRIYHERETHLLQQVLSVKTSLPPPLRETHQSALHSQKQITASTAHTTAIRTLMTAFPPLSTTIRLLKRFVASHHLSLHLPCEVLETIAAHVFLNPLPWSTPGTATTGFARCLHFLSRWDWSTDPLIADLSLSQDMSVEQRRDLETRFAAWRKMDPNMNTVSWFVGTNIDSTGVVWTQGVAGLDPKPPRVIAGRVSALANAALDFVKSRSEGEKKIMTSSDWDPVFSSTLDDFDFVLHLRGRSKVKKNGQFKNLVIAARLDADTTGIDTVTSYIEDLQRCFGSVAIFFYGGKDGGTNVIGGLWRPHIRGKEARPWRIRLGYSTTPVPMPAEVETGGEEAGKAAAEKAPCRANIDGMLAEMSMMGEGIVERITMKET